MQSLLFCSFCEESQRYIEAVHLERPNQTAATVGLPCKKQQECFVLSREHLNLSNVHLAFFLKKGEEGEKNGY